MALKTFKEMEKIDISQYLKKRDGADYLPWGRCKQLLHDNGAEKVTFEPLCNDKGSTLFMSDIAFTDKNGVANRCYEVRVKVTIDDLVFIQNYPVLNGNNPVKDNSMSQLRVNNAIARAFVKGVAIHTGLGFEMWLEDGLEETMEENLAKHDIFAIQRRTQELYTLKLKKKNPVTGRKMTVTDIAQALGMSEDEVKLIFTYYDLLDRFEKKLAAL